MTTEQQDLSNLPIFCLRNGKMANTDTFPKGEGCPCGHCAAHRLIRQRDNEVAELKGILEMNAHGAHASFYHARKEIAEIKARADALESALFYRKVWNTCFQCGAQIAGGNPHEKDCPHFQTEKQVLRNAVEHGIPQPPLQEMKDEN